MTEKPSLLSLKSLPPEEIDDELLRAAWAYEDVTNLYHFAKNTLGFAKLVARPHADLCDFLANDGKYKGRLTNNWKLILLPRGTFKTTVACYAYPLWLLLGNPNLRILLDGETFAKSAASLRAIKGLITTNQKLHEFHGKLHEPISPEAVAFAKANRGLTWNEDEIVIGTRTDFSKREGSISVGGVDITKVGMHYDLVIGDDYHSERNITTREQIEKVVQHIQLMTAILDPGAKYIVIGTRWDDKDAYGWIIEDIEGIRIKQPGIYKGKHFDIMVYPWKMPDGTLFAPTILNEETIVPLKTMHTPYQFSCQYMNDPVDSETAIFKESWIKDNVLSSREANDLLEEMIIFTSVDPAVGITKDHDYSAIVTIGYLTKSDPDDGRLEQRRVLLDVHYGNWNPDRLVDEVLETTKRWKPVSVGFESISGFEAYQSVFRERCARLGRRVPLVYFKQDTKISKENRIQALAPMFQSGSFYMVKGARGLEEFWEEYRRFPRAKHDDVLDALADVEKFSYFPSPGGRRGGPEEEYKPLDATTGY